MATRSGVPARTTLRMAVRNEVVLLPGQAAAVRSSPPCAEEAVRGDAFARPMPEGTGVGDVAMEEDMRDDLLLPLNLVAGGALLRQELMPFRYDVEHALG